jgi:hypothetical protein
MYLHQEGEEEEEEEEEEEDGEEIEQEHEGKKVVVSGEVWVPSGLLGLRRGGGGQGLGGRVRSSQESPGWSPGLFSSLSTPSGGCFPQHCSDS